MTGEKMKKTVLVVLLCFLVGAIFVCILPIVRDVDFSAQGVEIKEEMLTQSNVEITIQGKRLNYVFREDKLNAAVTFNGYNATPVGPVLERQEGVFFVTLNYYNAEKDCFDFCKLTFDEDFNNVLITASEEGTYIASTDRGADLLEVFRRLS